VCRTQAELCETWRFCRGAWTVRLYRERDCVNELLWLSSGWLRALLLIRRPKAIDVHSQETKRSSRAALVQVSSRLQDGESCRLPSRSKCTLHSATELPHFTHALPLGSGRRKQERGVKRSKNDLPLSGRCHRILGGFVGLRYEHRQTCSVMQKRPPTCEVRLREIQRPFHAGSPIKCRWERWYGICR
jgi:hypothetical protein